MSAPPAWKLERDADGIVWLTLDKPGTSANVLSQRRAARARTRCCSRSSAHAAARAGDPLRQEERLHRRRGHQGIHRASPTPTAAIELDPRRPAGVRSPRSAALPHRGGHPRLCARAAASSSRWPAAIASRSATSGCHSGCPKCSWAFTGFRRHRAHRAAARRAAGHGDDADRQAGARREGAARSGWSIDWWRGRGAGRCRAARSCCSRPPPHRPPLVERLLSSRRCAPFVQPALIAQVAAKAPAGALSGPLRHHRSVGALRRARRGGLRGRGALHRAPVHDRDLAQSGARVPAAGSPQGPGRQEPRADIKHVHVVGAGVMGGDIAAWCALRGFTVTLQDRSLEIHRAGAAARRGSCSTSGCAIRPRSQRRARAPARRCRRRRRARTPMWSSRRSSRTSRPSASCMPPRAAHEARRPARDQHLEPDAGAAGRDSSPTRSAWSDCISSIPCRRCR